MRHARYAFVIRLARALVRRIARRWRARLSCALLLVVYWLQVVGTTGCPRAALSLLRGEDARRERVEFLLTRAFGDVGHVRLHARAVRRHLRGEEAIGSRVRQGEEDAR